MDLMLIEVHSAIIRYKVRRAEQGMGLPGTAAMSTCKSNQGLLGTMQRLNSMRAADLFSRQGSLWIRLMMMTRSNSGTERNAETESGLLPSPEATGPNEHGLDKYHKIHPKTARLKILGAISNDPSSEQNSAELFLMLTLYANQYPTICCGGQSNAWWTALPKGVVIFQAFSAHADLMPTYVFAGSK